MLFMLLLLLQSFFALLNILLKILCWYIYVILNTGESSYKFYKLFIYVISRL